MNSLQIRHPLLTRPFQPILRTPAAPPMNHFLGDLGKSKRCPRRDEATFFPTTNSNSTFGKTSFGEYFEAKEAPRTHSKGPIVTGTSVLGIKFNGGVMLSADCLASYGSLARFKDVQRVCPIGKNTVLGSSGDISDFQHILHLLDQIQTTEYCHADGLDLSAPQLHNILCGIMYNKRSEMKPLWNAHIVGGVDADGTPFLGYVDLKGVAYKADSIASGYGAYIAQPLLRKALEERGGAEGLGEAEARAVLEECMRVLYYRDARSINKIQLATITAATGITITAPYELETNWEVAMSVRGY